MASPTKLSSAEPSEDETPSLPEANMAVFPSRFSSNENPPSSGLTKSSASSATSAYSPDGTPSPDGIYMAPLSPDSISPPPPSEEVRDSYISASCYKEKNYHHSDPEGNPGAKIWIVQAGDTTKAATGRSWSVWIEPAYYEERKALNDTFLSWITQFDSVNGKSGFSMGRPMTEFCVQVPLCTGARRPQTLVSGQDPIHGTASRGCNNTILHTLGVRCFCSSRMTCN